MELKLFTFIALTWVVLDSPVGTTTNPNPNPNPCKGLNCSSCDNPCVLVSQYCKSPPCTPSAQCTRNPCRRYNCSEGEYCYPQQVECIRAPCYPVASCHNPCAELNCTKGKEKCTIKYYDCPCGSYCPPYAVCQNPCLNHGCPQTEVCKTMFDGHQTIAYCQSPCASMPCEHGYECHVRIQPNGKPKAVCVKTPNNPCAGLKCDRSKNEVCVLASQLCPHPPCKQIAVCAQNLCENYKKKCPKNQICYLKQVECFTTPCYPQPKCKDPFEEVKCKRPYQPKLQYYNCGKGNYCPPTAVCVHS